MVTASGTVEGKAENGFRNSDSYLLHQAGSSGLLSENRKLS